MVRWYSFRFESKSLMSEWWDDTPSGSNRRSRIRQRGLKSVGKLDETYWLYRYNRMCGLPHDDDASLYFRLSTSNLLGLGSHTYIRCFKRARYRIAERLQEERLPRNQLLVFFIFSSSSRINACDFFSTTMRACVGTCGWLGIQNRQRLPIKTFLNYTSVDSFFFPLLFTSEE